jgi:hypothetical protein
MPAEQVLARIRRALLLDSTAFEEVRDDAAFTPYAIAAAAVAVLLAGFGSWLWGEVVLDYTPSGWFVDTVILGSIFTALLFLAGVLVTYVVLTQVYRETAAADAIVRLVTLTYIPFGLGFLVFIPQIGFAFGILSIGAMFFYTIFGLRSAYPAIAPMHVMVAVLAGFAVWAVMIPLISDAPDNNFTTGVFVYSLFEP